MSEYTAKVQQYKKDAVEELKTHFREGHDYIFADYRGLNVEQITDLRGKLRETGASFRVIKNRYAKIAMRELKLPDVSDLLIGPTALALPGEDTSVAAKILIDIARDTTLGLKGAIIDGEIFDDAQVESYSRLPSKNVLISQLMSALNGSVTNLMYVLKAIPEKLVRTLQAVADSKEESK